MFRLTKKAEKNSQQLDQEVKKHNKKMLKITNETGSGLHNCTFNLYIESSIVQA